MRRASAILWLLPWFLLFPVEASRADSDEARRPGRLFAEVARVLQQRFYDAKFRAETLPGLVARHQETARRATDGPAERQVIRRLLTEIPASHLALLSEHTFLTIRRELDNEGNPSLGLELARHGEAYFVHRLVEGGVAAKAGLLRGDRIVRIDGIGTAASPLLDWSSDDPALPDPPIHFLRVQDGQTVRLLFERTPGERRRLSLVARHDSTLEAAARSATLIERAGRRIGYVHLWYLHTDGPARLLRRLLARDLASGEALILDLRGRGGRADMVGRLLRVFEGSSRAWDRPLVLLVDANTRSAKEVLADELRRRGRASVVGEPTAGAVLPVSFARIGPGAVLMYPGARIEPYSSRLEGIGVRPDVLVVDPVPYSAGADPILEAGLVEAVRLAAESRRTAAAR